MEMYENWCAGSLESLQKMVNSEFLFMSQLSNKNASKMAFSQNTLYKKRENVSRSRGLVTSYCVDINNAANLYNLKYR